MGGGGGGGHANDRRRYETRIREPAMFDPAVVSRDDTPAQLLTFKLTVRLDIIAYV